MNAERRKAILGFGSRAAGGGAFELQTQLRTNYCRCFLDVIGNDLTECVNGEGFGDNGFMVVDPFAQ